MIIDGFDFDKALDLPLIVYLKLHKNVLGCSWHSVENTTFSQTSWTIWCKNYRENLSIRFTRIQSPPHLLPPQPTVFPKLCNGDRGLCLVIKNMVECWQMIPNIHCTAISGNHQDMSHDPAKALTSIKTCLMIRQKRLRASRHALWPTQRLRASRHVSWPTKALTSIKTRLVTDKSAYEHQDMPRDRQKRLTLSSWWSHRRTAKMKTEALENPVLWISSTRRARSCL